MKKLNLQEFEFGTEQFCFDDRLDLDLFELNILDEDEEVRPDDSEPSRYMKPLLDVFLRASVRYDHAEDLAKDLKVGFGERVNVVMSGNFVYGDFLEAWLTNQEVACVRCYISTLSMSEQNVNSLKALMDNDWIADLHLFLSSYFYAHEVRKMMPTILNSLDRQDKNGSFQCSISSMHIKVILLQLADGRFITMHGSANLRSSACLEQLCIEEGVETWKFYYELFNNVEKKYHIINQSIRSWKAFEGMEKKIEGQQ